MFCMELLTPEQLQLVIAKRLQFPNQDATYPHNELHKSIFGELIENNVCYSSQLAFSQYHTHHQFIIAYTGQLMLIMISIYQSIFNAFIFCQFDEHFFIFEFLKLIFSFISKVQFYLWTKIQIMIL